MPHFRRSPQYLPLRRTRVKTPFAPIPRLPNFEKLLNSILGLLLFGEYTSDKRSKERLDEIFAYRWQRG
jgi:hypothetical protein